MGADNRQIKEHERVNTFNIQPNEEYGGQFGGAQISSSNYAEDMGSKYNDQHNLSY